MSFAIVLPAILVIIVFTRRTISRRRRSIARVPGPHATSWLYGNMLQLYLPATWGEFDFSWQRQYGPLYRIKGCFGEDRLVVSDPRALQHILSSALFARPPGMQNSAKALFGEGSVLVLRGEPHRRARSALNPVFSASAIRKLLPLFERTAAMLTSNLETSLSPASAVDVSPVLFTATMSAISEAVFGCSLQDVGYELVENHRQLLVMAAFGSPAHLLSVSLIEYLPSWCFQLALSFRTGASIALQTSQKLTQDLGTRMVRKKLDASRKGLEAHDDIYSMLLHPDNADKKGGRMSEAEVAAQTALLLLAGQDTTANTLAFALCELAKDPDFQARLRAEINSSLAIESGNYDNLPLLNAFIKETLRMYPAESISEMMALEDTSLPLTYGLTTTSDEKIAELPIRKGQVICVAIGSYNRLESIWGPDAHEFKPSRWLDGTPYTADAPHIGPYSNLLTFYNGPHTCLGWRFALLEIQVLICELVSKFSFSLPEDDCARPRFASTLIPVTRNGKKNTPLHVTRLM
ncbi:cytochrome P450 [Mycena rebaudengoi]|nr:cytochrome P450 [Mycena rebaudengoi]